MRMAKLMYLGTVEGVRVCSGEGKTAMVRDLTMEQCMALKLDLGLCIQDLQMFYSNGYIQTRGEERTGKIVKVADDKSLPKIKERYDRYIKVLSRCKEDVVIDEETKMGVILKGVEVVYNTYKEPQHVFVDLKFCGDKACLEQLNLNGNVVPYAQTQKKGYGLYNRRRQGIIAPGSNLTDLYVCECKILLEEFEAIKNNIWMLKIGIDIKEGVCFRCAYLDYVEDGELLHHIVVKGNELLVHKSDDVRIDMVGANTTISDFFDVVLGGEDDMDSTYYILKI